MDIVTTLHLTTKPPSPRPDRHFHFDGAGVFGGAHVIHLQVKLAVHTAQCGGIMADLVLR